MADNNGSKFKEKISISIPVEMLEVLENFSNFYGMSRSSAISFLLAQGLCFESSKTNGFDFESIVVSDVDRTGNRYTLKRKDVDANIGHWEYTIGRNNQGKFVIVSSEDFE